MMSARWLLLLCLWTVLAALDRAVGHLSLATSALMSWRWAVLSDPAAALKLYCADQDVALWRFLPEKIAAPTTSPCRLRLNWFTEDHADPVCRTTAAPPITDTARLRRYQLQVGCTWPPLLAPWLPKEVTAEIRR